MQRQGVIISWAQRGHIAIEASPLVDTHQIQRIREALGKLVPPARLIYVTHPEVQSSMVEPHSLLEVFVDTEDDAETRKSAIEVGAAIFGHSGQISEVVHSDKAQSNGLIPLTPMNQ